MPDSICVKTSCVAPSYIQGSAVNTLDETQAMSPSSQNGLTNDPALLSGPPLR